MPRTGQPRDKILVVLHQERSSAGRVELPGAQTGRDHLGGRLIWDMHLKRWLQEFLATIFDRQADRTVA